MRRLFYLLLLALGVGACADVDPGYEAFYYYKYGSGIDTTNIIYEGVHSCAPWNDVIKYNVRQQTRAYKSSVMDKNGTEITIVASINFSLIKGKSPAMHMRHGHNYPKTFVDVKVKGAIKDVVGRYTFEDVFSKKREALEAEIEELLANEFGENYLELHFVEVADVNLPEKIQQKIVEKESQEQTNLIARKKKREQEYLADAKIEQARGDSARVIIAAQAEAQSIEIKQKQLMKSPQYIEYIKAESWDGSFGTGNVFGEGVTLFKKM